MHVLLSQKWRVRHGPLHLHSVVKNCSMGEGERGGRIVYVCMQHARECMSRWRHVGGC